MERLRTAASEFVARFPLHPRAFGPGRAQARQDATFFYCGARRATGRRIGRGGLRRRNQGEVWRGRRRPFLATRPALTRRAKLAGLPPRRARFHVWPAVVIETEALSPILGDQPGRQEHLPRLRLDLEPLL